MEKLPFSPTPPIIRYLKRMHSEILKRHQGLLPGQRIGKFQLTFETYEVDEPFMSHYEQSRLDFLDYLQSRDALIVVSNGTDSGRVFEDVIEPKVYESQDEFLLSYSEPFPVEFTVEILNSKTIIGLKEYLDKNLNSKTKDHLDLYDSQNVKYNENTRTLWYHDKRIKFQSKKKDSKKVKLFNILWDNRLHTIKKFKMGKNASINTPELASLLKLSKPKLLERVKNLNTQLSEKGIPAKVEEVSEDSLLLIVTDTV